MLIIIWVWTTNLPDVYLIFPKRGVNFGCFNIIAFFWSPQKPFVVFSLSSKAIMRLCFQCWENDGVVQQAFIYAVCNNRGRCKGPRHIEPESSFKDSATSNVFLCVACYHAGCPFCNAAYFISDGVLDTDDESSLMSHTLPDAEAYGIQDVDVDMCAARFTPSHCAVQRWQCSSNGHHMLPATILSKSIFVEPGKLYCTGCGGQSFLLSLWVVMVTCNASEPKTDRHLHSLCGLCTDMVSDEKKLKAYLIDHCPSDEHWTFRNQHPRQQLGSILILREKPFIQPLFVKNNVWCWQGQWSALPDLAFSPSWQRVASWSMMYDPLSSTMPDWG